MIHAVQGPAAAVVVELVAHDPVAAAADDLVHAVHDPAAAAAADLVHAVRNPAADAAAVVVHAVQKPAVAAVTCAGEMFLVFAVWVERALVQHLQQMTRTL